jgi:hypothetical protein
VDRKQPAPGLAPCRAAVHLTATTLMSWLVRHRRRMREMSVPAGTPVKQESEVAWRNRAAERCGSASRVATKSVTASSRIATTARQIRNGSSMRGELRAAGSCDEPGRRQDAGCEDREGAVG